MRRLIIAAVVVVVLVQNLSSYNGAYGETSVNTTLQMSIAINPARAVPMRKCSERNMGWFAKRVKVIAVGRVFYV